jgi:glycosyltransferase involved in cell wall biosynthesis
VISDAERRTLLSLAPNARVHVVPNGLGPEPFQPNGPRERARLLFLGYQEVFHNRDAARFLVGEVFPRVRAMEPDATLDIAGRGAESLGLWARGEGVRIVGFVPRLEDALMHATVFVAPHRFAAGVQNKVVQAMASGTPVVSTPAVQQGLEPIPEGVMRVAEGADAIAAQIVTLIRNPTEAAALGARGRAWARSTFTWAGAQAALESNGRSREPARVDHPAIPAGA